MLKHAPLSNLFPSVQKVDVTIDSQLETPSHQEIIRCIVVPTLRHLRMGPSYASSIKPVITPLMECLRTILTSLRTLVLGGGVDIQVFTQLLREQAQIRHLGLRARPEEPGPAWHAAGTLLAELRSIDFDTRDHSPVELSGVGGMRGFPALADVTLVVHTETYLSSLLHTISSPHLRSLDIRCLNGDILRAAALSIGQFEQLRSLKIRSNTHEAPNLSIPMPIHPNLAELSVYGVGVARYWNDATIAYLAGSLPNLHALRIPERSPPSDRPVFTLVGILPLIRHCPNLQVLQISLDARGFTLPTDWIPRTAYTGGSLKSLNLQWSLANPEDVERLSEIFLELWPNLKAFETTWRSDREPQIGEIWERISASHREGRTSVSNRRIRTIIAGSYVYP